MSIPQRFEAGTPAIAEAIGLGAAADYLSQVGMDWVSAHGRALARYAYEQLSEIEGVRILGTTSIGPEGRGGAVSFTLRTADGLDIHPHDVMTFLDSRGVAVRGGHHCARPLHERLGITASTRASFYLYTLRSEIDQLVDALDYTRDFFGRVA